MKILKKIIYLMILIAIFILGLCLGTKDTVGKNQLVDNAKNDFESQITNPNNNYQIIANGYEENIFNRCAETIDEIIQNLFNRIKNKI